MKSPASILCGLCLLFSAGGASPFAQAQSVTPPPGPPDELELLVAPIALYPDPLVALILPASTESTDIVLAARHLDRSGSVHDVESLPWDDSVKGLVHYPELVQWLNENLAWTRQLGDAYSSQPEIVMAAIQRARARALANGTLVGTPQQQVIIENGNILILPAQSNVIYLPRYDPAIIYHVRSPDVYLGPMITFGTGFGVGWWLGFDCDWTRRVIWFDEHRRERWPEHRDWHRHDFPGRNGKPPPAGWRQWKPKAGRPPRPPSTSGGPRPHDPGLHPSAPPGAPHVDRHHPRSPSRRERENPGHPPPHPPAPPTVAEPKAAPPTAHRHHPRRENPPLATVTPPAPNQAVSPRPPGRDPPERNGHHPNRRIERRDSPNPPPAASRPAFRPGSPPQPTGRELRPPPQITPAPRPAPPQRAEPPEHAKDDDKGRNKDP